MIRKVDRRLPQEAAQKVLPYSPHAMDVNLLERTLVHDPERFTRLLDSILAATGSTSRSYTILCGPAGSGKSHILAALRGRLQGSPAARALSIVWVHESELSIETYRDLLLEIVRSHDGIDVDPKAAAGADAADAQADLEDTLERLLVEAAAARPVCLFLERVDAILESIGDDGQRRLRALLQTHPHFIIVGSARRRTAAIAEREAPFYGFFDVRDVRPLAAATIVDLAARVAEAEGSAGLSEAIRTPAGHRALSVLGHLTAGNPRCIVQFVQFATAETLADTLVPLLRLLDQQTPVARALLLGLSPQQRRIVLYLARRRHAVPVADIARDNFLTHQTASSQLKKLRDAEHAVSHAVGRESWYELRDPFLRLTLELEDRPADRLRPLVRFLLRLHDPSTAAGAAAKRMRELLSSAAGTANWRESLEDWIAEEPRHGYPSIDALALALLATRDAPAWIEPTQRGAWQDVLRQLAQRHENSTLSIAVELVGAYCDCRFDRDLRAPLRLPLELRTLLFTHDSDGAPVPISPPS